MLPEDQIRLVSCLVLSVIISFFLGKLTCPKRFTVISFIISFIFQLYVFQHQVIFLWVQQLMVYLLCRYGNRNKIGKIVLGETFVYLIIIQIRRMYVAYGENNVDITAVMMMQVFLYVGFAYNYQDGADNNNKNIRKIVNFPPLYQFIGYLFFLPATLVGPVFQFIDYQNYLHRKSHYSSLPQNTLPGIINQLKTFIMTFIIYIGLLSFKLEYMLTDEFMEQKIWYKILYMSLSIFAFRFKYYTAWSLGMIGMNATGITYNGRKQLNHSGKKQLNSSISQSDKSQNKQQSTKSNKSNSSNSSKLYQQKWDRIEVSDIMTFQLQQSMKMKADAWNKSVQLALKRYIYERIYEPLDTDTQKIKKKKQIKAQQLTLFVSAIWHGLYPGYFVSFFHWALLLQISQELFRIQRNNKRFQQIRQKFKYLQLLIVNFFLGYFGVCFVFMTFDNIWKFFSTMYFIPPILVYLGNLFVVRLALFSGKKKREERGDQRETPGEKDKKNS